MRVWILRTLAWWWVAAFPLTARAQGTEPPSVDTRGASARPGLVKIGSLYLTPYLRIGTLGLDTNVFHTAAARSTDFTASGGPGLELVRPLGRSSRLTADGGLDYVFFLKTRSQRKLNGYGSVVLDLRGVKTNLAVEERYEGTFARPSDEVAARVQETSESTRLAVQRRLAERWSLALQGDRTRSTAKDIDYLGTNLGETLSSDSYQARGELRMALTVKTQLVGGTESLWHVFPRFPDRDGRSVAVFGGLLTDSSALVAGRAVAGWRWFRLDRGGERQGFYSSVNASLSLSLRTKLGVAYTRDIAYSAFSTSGATPTNGTESTEVFAEQGLGRAVYLRLSGRVGRLTTDGQRVVLPPDDASRLPVHDRTREAGGELGYQFRARLRIGLSARYLERRAVESSVVQGLVTGLTVQYSPPQPSFR